MTSQHRLIVAPVVVRFQSVELEDGSLHAVETERAEPAYAVLHTCGEEIEILSLQLTREPQWTAPKSLAPLLNP